MLGAGGYQSDSDGFMFEIMHIKSKFDDISTKLLPVLLSL